MNPADSKNFPAELAYLAPALKELAKIPENDLNEDVETGTLDNALRERVKGLKLSAAVTRLTEDTRALKEWLKAEKVNEAWAIWISGYLMRPGPLARSLLSTRPPPPIPACPHVDMEIPEGWKCESILDHLFVRKGRVWLKINPTKKLENGIPELALRIADGPPANPGKWLKAEVQFGECRGYKYSYAQVDPVKWKAVEYVLEVDGGFVYARMSHEQGKDFDETDIERKLHTLRILPPE